MSKLLPDFLRGVKYYVTRNFQIPKHITFMVTRRCNANCVMCSLSKKADYELSISEIRDIFSDRLLHSIKSICLLGGEPFLRKDLPEIVKTLLEVQPEIRFLSIVTNGLTPSLIEKNIKEVISTCRHYAPINLGISISLLGTNNETYQRIAKVSDGYTLVTDTMHRLKILRRAFPLNIKLKTALQPMNLKELPYLLSLARLPGN